MDIIRGGVIMGVYLFIIIATYIFLSGPFDDMMTSFENLNLTNSDTEVESASTWGRLTFNIIFAGLAVVPLLWFIVWVFHREPDWRY